MSDPTLKDALLKQNGHGTIEQELARLRQTVADEKRRARRLTIWTVAVWATFIILLTLGIGVPMIAYHAAYSPNGRAATQPATQPESPAAHTSRPQGPVALKAIISLTLIAGFFALPLAGIVLTIMMILARRTAGMNQIRASLASIDAELRLLTLARDQGKGKPADPQGPAAS
ncbi:MAG: hypothetical protein JWN24_204 [Phycisphaerales bacterium]|nr:hypothetical protein [Phycisphaerales bacterium]